MDEVGRGEMRLGRYVGFNRRGLYCRDLGFGYFFCSLGSYWRFGILF